MNRRTAITLGSSLCLILAIGIWKVLADSNTSPEPSAPVARSTATPTPSSSAMAVASSPTPSASPTAAASSSSSSSSSSSVLPTDDLTKASSVIDPSLFSTGKGSGISITSTTSSTLSQLSSCLNGLIYAGIGGSIQGACSTAAGQVPISSSAGGVPIFRSISGDISLKPDGVATLSLSGVFAGTYGSSTQVPRITVDEKGRVTGVTLSTIDGGLSQGGFNPVTIQGTSNRVLVVQSGDDYTLSLPQDIHNGATPSFANLNVSGEYRIANISINEPGTLSNVAYENQANLFTERQTVVSGGLEVADGALINGSATTIGLEIPSGSILASGNVGDTPLNGAGRRMMWVPSLGAFRAGTVDGNQWDADKLGVNSFATGANNRVEGDSAFSSGQGNTVFGSYSFSSGLYNTVSGLSSGVIGYNNTVASNDSVALGSGNTVSGGSAIAGGAQSQTSGFSSIALGYRVQSAADYSVTVGSGLLSGGLLQNSLKGAFATGFNNQTPTFVARGGESYLNSEYGDLIGYIYVTDGSTAVTGSNTRFLTFFNPGDTFVVDGDTYTIASIESDSDLTITTPALAGGSTKGGGYGTIDTTNGSSTLTGVNTLFTKNFAVGDTVEIQGNIYSITSITSDTQMEIANSAVATVTNSDFTVIPSLITVRDHDNSLALIINSQRQVGIGTSMAEARLDVRSNIPTETLVLITGDGGRFAPFLQVNRDGNTVFELDAVGRIATGNALPGIPLVGVDPNSGSNIGDLSGPIGPLAMSVSGLDVTIEPGTAYASDTFGSGTTTHRCTWDGGSISVPDNSTSWIVVTAAEPAGPTGTGCGMYANPTVLSFTPSAPNLVIAKVVASGGSITSLADTRFYIGGTLSYVNLASPTEPGSIVVESANDNEVSVSSTDDETPVSGVIVVGGTFQGILMTSGNAWVQATTSTTRSGCAATSTTPGAMKSSTRTYTGSAQCIGSIVTSTASSSTPSALVRLGLY